MGQYWSSNHWSIEHLTFPHLRKSLREYPSDKEESPFDPLYGFPNGRKQRVMVATELEMDSAKLMPLERDYCAHLFMEMKGCFKRNCPFLWRCKHERHAFHDCEWEDQLLRMKEWERERRLREREYRKEKAKQRAEQLVG